jgi:hypothetical protein
MPQLKQCAGCAFRPGSEASEEPVSYLTAELCVLGPKSFHCHESVDYKNPVFGRPLSRQERRELAPAARVCGGWTKRVQELKATGYYDENPVETKVYASVATETLKDWQAEEDPNEKAELLEKLGEVLKSLNAKKRRFI